MYTGFTHLHSAIALLMLVLLVAAVVYALIGRSSQRSFDGTGSKLGLFALAAVHVQALLGVALYFMSPLGIRNFSGEAMADATSRLYLVEHPLTMIVAAILVTIGRVRSKRAADDRRKFGAMLIWYGIALVLVLGRIPWAAWR